MTDRNAYLLGAAMIAAGACLLAARVPAAVPTGIAAYVLLQAVVLRWGMLVYGAPGALGGLALSAFATPLLAGDAGLGAAAAWTLTAHVLTRALLDPTIQASLAIGAAGLAAVVLAGTPAIVPPLIVYSVLLALWRCLSAERWERRGRVLQASLVAALGGWTALLAVVAAIGHFSHLPEVEDFSALSGSMLVAAAVPAVPGGGLAALPLVPLLLAALRPWRGQRRYSDGAWLAALLCVVLSNRSASAAAMAPLLALLGGACWDAARPRWARRAATGLAALQGIGALLGLLAGSEPAGDGAQVRTV